ncbi:MAG: hypothetical protein HY975_02995 [Candidatus Kerfeldbacteria bacterium]|nr:hypothetical protein [Candidatus Kerfeldbacteria bacterium]
MVALALAYGAKVRWLVNSEPESVREALIEWSQNCMDRWDNVAPGELAADLKQHFRDEGLGSTNPATVPGGETFKIKLFAEWRVWNELPKQGMSVNVAWHYIVLLEAIHERLQGPDGNPVAHIPLGQFWRKDLQVAETFNGSDLSVLKTLTDKARESFNDFVAKLQETESAAS